MYSLEFKRFHCGVVSRNSDGLREEEGRGTTKSRETER
jgi:hypothetical protein